MWTPLRTCLGYVVVHFPSSLDAQYYGDRTRGFPGKTDMCNGALHRKNQKAIEIRVGSSTRVLSLSTSLYPRFRAVDAIKPQSDQSMPAE